MIPTLFGPVGWQILRVVHSRRLFPRFGSLFQFGLFDPRGVLQSPHKPYLPYFSRLKLFLWSSPQRSLASPKKNPPDVRSTCLPAGLIHLNSVPRLAAAAASFCLFGKAVGECITSLVMTPSRRTQRPRCRQPLRNAVPCDNCR